MIQDGRGGLYSRCHRCGNLVKVNKHLVGDLHLCEPEYNQPPPMSPRKARRIGRKRAKVVRKQHRRVQREGCCCVSIGDPGRRDRNGGLIPCRIHHPELVD